MRSYRMLSHTWVQYLNISMWFTAQYHPWVFPISLTILWPIWVILFSIATKIYITSQEWCRQFALCCVLVSLKLTHIHHITEVFHQPMIASLLRKKHWTLVGEVRKGREGMKRGWGEEGASAQSRGGEGNWITTKGGLGVGRVVVV